MAGKKSQGAHGLLEGLSLVAPGLLGPSPFFAEREIPLSFTASSVTVAKHEGPALFCMEAIFLYLRVWAYIDI